MPIVGTITAERRYLPAAWDRFISCEISAHGIRTRNLPEIDASLTKKSLVTSEQGPLRVQRYDTDHFGPPDSLGEPTLRTPCKTGLSSSLNFAHVAEVP